jgi:copper chaperone CopZ
MNGESLILYLRVKNSLTKEITMRKLLKIEGMSCGHCVMHVRSALEDVPGVKSAKVDLLERTAMVDGENLNDQALRAAVAEAGYSVSSIMP